MALSSTEFQFIADLAYKHAAIVIDEKKKYLVESRLTKLMNDEFLWSPAELIEKLKSPSGLSLRAKVIDTLTINETSFFRDGHPFEELRQNLMPELIKLRATEKQINIWCAASSTGQEPYSIAMTIRQHFPQLSSWRIKIVASDISDRVLEQARAGRYSQLEANRGLSPVLLSRFFTRDKEYWVANKELKDIVEFKKLNLSEPFVGLPKLDIVFIRNVMIYFDVETKKQIITKIARTLRPDGFIALGTAETMLGISDEFERRSGCRGAIYIAKKR